MTQTESNKLTKKLLLIQHIFTKYTPVGQDGKASKFTEKGSKHTVKTKIVAGTVARERWHTEETLN